MDDKKVVYNIIFDLWNLAKEFLFHKSVDWQKVIEIAESNRHKYLDQGEAFGELYTDMYNAIQRFAEKRESTWK